MQKAIWQKWAYTIYLCEQGGLSEFYKRAERLKPEIGSIIKILPVCTETRSEIYNWSEK